MPTDPDGTERDWQHHTKDGTVAEFDQAQARALDNLKKADAFFLVTLDREQGAAVHLAIPGAVSDAKFVAYLEKTVAEIGEDPRDD